MASRCGDFAGRTALKKGEGFWSGERVTKINFNYFVVSVRSSWLQFLYPKDT